MYFDIMFVFDLTLSSVILKHSKSNYYVHVTPLLNMKSL